MYASALLDKTSAVAIDYTYWRLGRPKKKKKKPTCNKPFILVQPY
jgi:hypothetical protein